MPHRCEPAQARLSWRAPAMLAVAGIFLTGGPAEARGPRLVHPNGTPVGGHHQRWVDESLMPMVPGPLTIRFEACPGNPRADGCVYRSMPSVIYMRRGAGRGLLYHELGHLFDYRFLHDADRRAFMRLIGAPGRRWRAGRNGPSEWFAEGYSACSRSLRPAAAAGARRHRAMGPSACRLVRRAARRSAGPPPSPAEPAPPAAAPAPPPERRSPWFLHSLWYPG